MDHRTALAAVRNLVRRTGSTAGRTAGRAARTLAREVGTRVAERRSARATSSPPTPASATEPTASRAPTPADVARAVARNTAGLARTNPTTPRRAPARPSAPGARLPARAGQGILGV